MLAEQFRGINENKKNHQHILSKIFIAIELNMFKFTEKRNWV